MVGVHPGGWTLRDLVWAAEAKRAAAWDHTAVVLALTANCHRDPKRRRRPFEAAEFHPWPERVKRKRRSGPKAKATALRDVLIFGRLPDELADLPGGGEG